MKKLLITSLLIVFIIAGGCIQPDISVISATLENPFQLKINQVGFIKSENIKIFFMNVTEDSRCPSDVNCIWPGQVTILINIVKKNKVLGEFNLTIGAGFNELATKEFDGYSIQLLKVEPYPISTKKIALSDYVVTLNASKL